MDLFTALREAAGTGEILTVIYHGGTHPGHKRRIIVTDIDDENRISARQLPGNIIKTYWIEKTELCDADHPAPWMPERHKWIETDPVAYFADWHYHIFKHFYSALGFDRREYVDKKKPKSAAGQAKPKYMAYALSDPLQHDFHDGDVFKSKNAQELIQVISLLGQKNDTPPQIEAHYLTEAGGRQAFRLTIPELVTWLKTGVISKNAKRLRKSATDRQIMQQFINETIF